MKLSSRTPSRRLCRRPCCRYRGTRFAIPIVCITLAFATGLGAAGCLKDDRPNVLLITVDTLRADHLGAYGYALNTSPNIDALAGGGAVIERCISTAPETAPGTASLLTGLYQDEHGVTHNRRILPDDVTTLAEYLAGAGYATAAFTGNLLVGPKFGFNQGFDVMETFEGIIPIVPRDPIGTAAAADWLAAHARSDDASPWFVWVHYLDPHGPYTPADNAWNDALEYDSKPFGEDPELEIADTNFGLGVIPKYQQLPGRNRLSQYVRRYDGEIRSTDVEIGKLVAAARDAGSSDSTLIIVSADHGESLVEHREYLQHGWFLYDTTLRVPLIFHFAGVIAEGKRIETQTSSVDLVPTVLDLVGMDFAGQKTHGRSIAPALRGNAKLDEVAAYAFGPRENHPFAISLDGYKLISTRAGTPDPQINGAGDTPTRYELYSVVEDPGETRELGADTSQYTRLRKQLAQYEIRFNQRLWERGRELLPSRRERQAASK